MPPAIEHLAANLKSIADNVSKACSRVARDPAGVTLVAVTKYASWNAVQQLAELHSKFGESRPQQLAERAPQLPAVNWHLIGQLQRNKVHLAVQHAALIHSVDALRLLERIRNVTAGNPMHSRVLLQLNLSGEHAKSGFRADEIRNLWPEILQHSGDVHIEGLMTMAARSDDAEEARPVFQQLRNLRDELVSLSVSNGSDVTLPHLSMGMSRDFIPAVEEGATLIRIGSRIFEGVHDEA
jgi:PLP dependent protein